LPSNGNPAYLKPLPAMYFPTLETTTNKSILLTSNSKLETIPQYELITKPIKSRTNKTSDYNINYYQNKFDYDPRTSVGANTRGVVEQYPGESKEHYHYSAFNGVKPTKVSFEEFDLLMKNEDAYHAQQRLIRQYIPSIVGSVTAVFLGIYFAAFFSTVISYSVLTVSTVSTEVATAGSASALAALGATYVTNGISFSTLTALMGTEAVAHAAASGAMTGVTTGVGLAVSGATFGIGLAIGIVILVLAVLAILLLLFIPDKVQHTHINTYMKTEDGYLYTVDGQEVGKPDETSGNTRTLASPRDNAIDKYIPAFEIGSEAHKKLMNTDNYDAYMKKLNDQLNELQRNQKIVEENNKITVPLRPNNQ
ncbi:MAG: hypothetical protein EZS28_034234, partial [Streblomastix strix]